MSTAGFKEVSTRVDFPAIERQMIEFWNENGVVASYLQRNAESDRRWSFLDGPITANNSMGVHHAWGRTYKDLFQRFHAMLGEHQRFQNGFDCQGLWVEVEVEKELGLKSKRDIESYGIAEFVNRCKERVWHFSDRQTEQSKRLGYWMDWDNSYFTMSDENNYTIWHFLKSCHEKGLIYKGHDVMPWCPRCGTGISEHEIVTEGYQERTHLSVFVKFPLVDAPGESLLVWTTTPWTLAANVAAAVHPELVYVRVQQGDEVYLLAKDAVPNAIRGEFEIIEELPGSQLIGRHYLGPFDELPAASDVSHRMIGWHDVGATEGTGIVHIAPGAGREDFGLSKSEDLAVIAPIDEFGVYGDGFDWLSSQYVHDVAKPIEQDLKQKELLYRSENYKHRYPVCWRCGTDLVFRLVDEWFIAMDELRQPMMDATRQMNWVPSFGMDRELDWLMHMDDWMISKKRYWGLALPIYECQSCGNFDVIGSEDELRDRAIAGYEEFAGHTPHRPWIDAVKIACSDCGAPVDRIKDVGNPWLDAGIVGFSTLNYRTDKEYWASWFPADLISESFPGQFRNWFYSLIAQSVALENLPPARNVFSYALMRDEHGEEMHKSKGNAIWFDEAAEVSGVDVMRWLYCTVNPSQNMNFGYSVLDEVRRRFILPLWNSYAFFANYARLDAFDPLDRASYVPVTERPLLDRWVITRLNQVIEHVHHSLQSYAPEQAGIAIERFVVDELSNWYIRRNRRRFWKSGNDSDKAAAYQTLYEVLTSVTRLLAPFTPFLAEEIYQNLVRAVDSSAPQSVHLTDYPVADSAMIDAALAQDMKAVLEVVSLGRAARSEANIKVRQPLPALYVYSRDSEVFAAAQRMHDQIEDELNVKQVLPLVDPGDVVAYDIRPNLSLLGPKYGKRLGALREALNKVDPAEVARLTAAGTSLELRLAGGDTVELNPQELLVDLVKKPGYAAAQSDMATVALDTTVTPELQREGIARDFVRGVQDARRSAGYRVEDRINIQAAGSDDLLAAVQAHRTYILAECLADELETIANGFTSSTGDGHYSESIEVGENQAEIRLSRAV